MNFKEYFSKINVQKKIDKLAKKYKGKKIALYGAGSYASTLFENYDFSKLNIVAIADKKFEKEENKNFFNLNCVAPEDLKTLDYDLILIANFDVLYFWDYLENELLEGSANEDVKIRPLIHENLFDFIKKTFSN